MLTRLLATLCLLLFATTAYADGLSAEVIFRGIFRSPLLPKASAENPPPDINLGHGWVGPRPRQATTQIVGVRGVDFGFLFIPRRSETLPGTPVTLRYVTRYPEPGLLKPGAAKALEGAQSEIDCLVGLVCTARYIFDEEWEIVPGEWQFEIYSGAELLFRESVHVLLPTVQK